MQISENNRSGYTLTLLFMFLFGALMSTLYVEQINSICSFGREILCGIFLTSLFVDSLLTASLNGFVLLPFTSIISGIATSLWIYEARLAADTGNDLVYELLILLFLVPAHFMICGNGMAISSQIRQFSSIRKEFYRKSLFSSYTFMLVSATALMLYAGYIILI